MAAVLVPLAPGFEELEAVTIIDLLRRAQITVTVAGLTTGTVKGSRGTVIHPDAVLAEALAHDYDMIVLPGGQPGATNLENDPRILALLRKMAAQNKIIGAICAAPKVLAAAGILNGKRATGYPGTLDPTKFPQVRIEKLANIVDGRIITSRGPGTAMDFALELIQQLAGKETRERVESGLVRDH